MNPRCWRRSRKRQQTPASAVGVVIFVGQRDFDGNDADGALAHARDVIWAISAAVRAVPAAGTGSRRGCSW